MSQIYNTIIDDLAKSLLDSGLGIEPTGNKIDSTSREDAKLFYECFEKDINREFHYANSWFYLTQAVNSVNKLKEKSLGLKYYNKQDNCLMAIGIFLRKSLTTPASSQAHFHIVNPTPLDDNLHLRVDELTQKLYNLSKTPVYIKKLDWILYSQLKDKPNYYKILLKEDISDPKTNDLSWRRFIDWKYAWHEQAPMEDDTWPEIILNIKEALKFLHESKSNAINRQINKIKKKFKDRGLRYENVSFSNMEKAKIVVEEFFKKQQENHIDISEPADYYNMIETSPTGHIDKQYIQRIYFAGEEPAALLCTERIGTSNCHGLYSNLSLYQDPERTGLSEYIIKEALEHLRQLEPPVKYLNMGGSEGQGLNSFKKKFTRTGDKKHKYSKLHKTQRLYWLVYDKK